jgi:hypothetical protein
MRASSVGFIGQVSQMHRGFAVWRAVGHALGVVMWRRRRCALCSVGASILMAGIGALGGANIARRPKLGFDGPAALTERGLAAATGSIVLGIATAVTRSS